MNERKRAYQWKDDALLSEHQERFLLVKDRFSFADEDLRVRTVREGQLPVQQCAPVELAGQLLAHVEFPDLQVKAT